MPTSGTLTVEGALKLAGDVTERGDVDRITITRRVDGKPIETAAKLTDALQPNDLVQVGRKPAGAGRR